LGECPIPRHPAGFHHPILRYFVKRICLEAKSYLSDSSAPNNLEGMEALGAGIQCLLPVSTFRMSSIPAQFHIHRKLISLLTSFLSSVCESRLVEIFGSGPIETFKLVCIFSFLPQREGVTKVGTKSAKSLLTASSWLPL
ncbi:hypothetical protein E2320_018594, partial [Naja naja]